MARTNQSRRILPRFSSRHGGGAGKWLNFHDSSMKTLEQAVNKMAKHQLGRYLTDQQAVEIVALLKSLTGEIPAEYNKKRPF